MSDYKKDVLEEASRVLSYILSENLSAEEKDNIVNDSVYNFNEHVNPGSQKVSLTDERTANQQLLLVKRFLICRIIWICNPV